MNDFGKAKTKIEEERSVHRHKIVEMWLAGNKIKDICEELGCARSTVSTWINRLVT